MSGSLSAWFFFSLVILHRPRLFDAYDSELFFLDPLIVRLRSTPRQMNTWRIAKLERGSRPRNSRSLFHALTSSISQSLFHFAKYGLDLFSFLAPYHIQVSYFLICEQWSEYLFATATRLEIAHSTSQKSIIIANCRHFQPVPLYCSMRTL